MANLINLNEETKYYLENEINYIQDQIQIEGNLGYNQDGNIKDLEYLKSLTDEDINEIACQILESESFIEYLNEEIHYRLYHLKKRGEQ